MWAEPSALAFSRLQYRIGAWIEQPFPLPRSPFPHLLSRRSYRNRVTLFSTPSPPDLPIGTSPPGPERLPTSTDVCGARVVNR